MDFGDLDGGFDVGFGGLEKKCLLFVDLLWLLDDWRYVFVELLVFEMEMYDGW